MSRTRLWGLILMGGALYAGIKIVFGWQDERIALATLFEGSFWSGATLLIQWASVRRDQ